MHYKSYFQQVRRLRVESCAYLLARIFWSTCMYSSLITMAGEQVVSFEELFRRLPVLVD